MGYRLHHWSCSHVRKFRNYHGQTVSIAPHIKGHSGNPKDNIRLHYYADAERRLIVIGHCGAHLETADSSKVKH